MADIVMTLAKIESKVANNFQEMANIAKAEVAFFLVGQYLWESGQFFNNEVAITDKVSKAESTSVVFQERNFMIRIQ